MRRISTMLFVALMCGCSSEVVIDAEDQCEAETCDGTRYGVWWLDAEADDLLRHLHIYSATGGVVLHTTVTFEHQPMGIGQACLLSASFDAPLDVGEPTTFWTDQTAVSSSNVEPEICGEPGATVTVELEPDDSCGGEAMRVRIDHDQPSSVFDAVGLASHCDCGDDDEPPFGFPNPLPSSCL